jgi:uncharacterized protein (DUF736 family)
MANALGYVSEADNGFQGTLAMMNLVAAIRIERNPEKDDERQPDYRIYAGEASVEVGGGWLRKAKVFVVSLVDRCSLKPPSFPSGDNKEGVSLNCTYLQN